MSTNQLASDLGAQINAAHERAKECAASAVEHAQRAGELLQQAKASVSHGQWAAWLAENVTFSERSARGYMRLARELPTLPEAKRQRVAEMPLRDASKELWKMQREEREAERVRKFKTPSAGSTAQPGNADQVVSLWTSARQVLEAAARHIAPLNEIQRRVIRDDFKAFVPLLPGDWAQLPEGVLAEAEAARARFLAEAKARATELIRWVDEQRAALVRLIQTAAEYAADLPEIYVGTQDGGCINADIRFLGVPTWKLPPELEDEDESDKPNEFVDEYLRAHPGSTVNDALAQAADDLGAMVSRFAFKRHDDEGEWKRADGTEL